jgi:hypothetical protein
VVLTLNRLANLSAMLDVFPKSLAVSSPLIAFVAAATSSSSSSAFFGSALGAFSVFALGSSLDLLDDCGPGFDFSVPNT